MFRKASQLLCVGMLISCSIQNNRKIGSIEPNHRLYKEYQEYESVLHEFHIEIGKALELRKRSVAFYVSEKSEGKKQFFNGKDLELIQTAVSEYTNNRENLLEIIEKYRSIVADNTLILTTDRRTEQVIKSRLILSGKQKLYINPNDLEGQLYIKKIKMGLSAALTLYDNYIIGVRPYQENGRFRRIINSDNHEIKNTIKKVASSFKSRTNYKNTLKAVEFVDDFSKLEANSLGKDKDISYFNLLIEGSYTNKKIKDISLIDRISFNTKIFRLKLRDFFMNTTNETVNQVSALFGNSVGLIQTRKGYLKNLSKKHKNKLQSQLKAGDILLEKTPFRLTDRFIPGHWGHVAVWVGSEKELKKLGVWDELPALYKKAQSLYKYEGASFQQSVLNGNKIVEALRPGVQINSLDHFLNIDDFAAIRDQKISKKDLKRYILRAFSQIGKDYDFNFDVETDKKIVCSELAFVVYNDYHWPVEKAVGRYTISPDNVAQQSMNSGPFTPVILYHDGKKLSKNIQENFNLLMNLDYEKVQENLVEI